MKIIKRNQVSVAQVVFTPKKNNLDQKSKIYTPEQDDEHPRLL